MENDFLEFDEPEEQLPEMIPAIASPVDDIKDGDDIVSKFVGINWFLLVVVFNLSVLHAFSNNWINFVSNTVVEIAQIFFLNSIFFSDYLLICP